MTLDFAIIRDDTLSDQVRRGAIIAIGNFDGVHRGHRAVIESALAMGRRSGRPVFAATFEPHPRTFFSRSSSQFRLTDEANKMRVLAGAGLDGAVIFSFNQKLADTSAHDFIAGQLIERLGVTGIAAGYNFHFGKDRSGSPDLLLREGAKLNVDVHIEPQLRAGEEAVSSSRIRSALESGDVQLANSLLGYTWFTSATVGPEFNGQHLRYPATNLVLDPGCRLANGVYAVRIHHGSDHLEGVASLQRHATTGGVRSLLKLHLVDFGRRLNVESLHVAFLARLRSNLVFDTFETATEQVTRDAAEARVVFTESPATSFLNARGAFS